MSVSEEEQFGSSIDSNVYGRLLSVDLLCVPDAIGGILLRCYRLVRLAPLVSRQPLVTFHHHLVPSVDVVADGLALVLGPLRDVQQRARCGEHGRNETERNESLPWHRLQDVPDRSGGGGIIDMPTHDRPRDNPGVWLTAGLLSAPEAWIVSEMLDTAVPRPPRAAAKALRHAPLFDCSYKTRYVPVSRPSMCATGRT